MKEEDLQKAIKLKKSIDDKRELLKFANSYNVDLRVNLEERCDHGRIRDVGYILGDRLIEDMKAEIIASIEKSIYDLLDKLEKL